MRVIAGEAKGRKLKGATSEATRPIMDRVKTALFDILSWRVEDVRFLDLFAGTGSVGIEALSRGARAATFVELDAAALKIVRENLQITRLGDRAEMLRSDAFVFLRAAHLRGERYDMVYVAPPQYQGLAGRALLQMDAEPVTPPGGLVIAQVHPREGAELAELTLERLRRYDERRYGSTLLVFYEDATPKPDAEAEAEASGV